MTSSNILSTLLHFWKLKDYVYKIKQNVLSDEGLSNLGCRMLTHKLLLKVAKHSIPFSCLPPSPRLLFKKKKDLGGGMSR